MWSEILIFFHPRVRHLIVCAGFDRGSIKSNVIFTVYHCLELFFFPRTFYYTPRGRWWSLNCVKENPQSPWSPATHGSDRVRSPRSSLPLDTGWQDPQCIKDSGGAYTGVPWNNQSTGFHPEKALLNPQIHIPFPGWGFPSPSTAACSDGWSLAAKSNLPLVCNKSGLSTSSNKGTWETLPRSLWGKQTSQRQSGCFGRTYCPYRKTENLR